ncbi:hypothetical protein DFH08DRAFT_782651 [Mycena albidolilacea]|uniref:Uncharacterized protein n=1 Tax=Mycena albidolilacea TaxID=1033008 RepID=A0AAD6ZW79_9AGAR|nr:hypothetical protein DFH08DRAFT_782651 [Mycena albidolilacea]
MRLGLVNYYTSLGEQVHLSGNTDNSEPLGSHAQFFHYVLLDGRRIRSIKYPESKHGSIGCSLIQIQYRGEIFSGEVQTIFQHKQEGLFDPQLRDRLLVHIQWMKPALEGNPLDPQLGVETWEYNSYLSPNDPQSPPLVIGMDEIQCPVSRGKISFTKPPLWITTSMDRFPTSMAAYGMGQEIEGPQ